MISIEQLNVMKEEFIKRSKKPGELRSDPVLSPYPFIYFTCDGDPTPSEPTYIGYPGLIYFWLNTVSNDLFICVDCTTEDNLIWKKIITSS